MNRFATTLANDKELLQGFVESYAKAATKNSEYIEAIRRVVKILESMVSYDIFLTNPLDEIVLDGKSKEILLEIAQTDKVFGEYDDIILPPKVVADYVKNTHKIFVRNATDQINLKKRKKSSMRQFPNRHLDLKITQFKDTGILRAQT